MKAGKILLQSIPGGLFTERTVKCEDGEIVYFVGDSAFRKDGYAPLPKDQIPSIRWN